MIAAISSKRNTTIGSNKSMISSLYDLKRSAAVMIAVLQTALLGFFNDFTVKEITSSLVKKVNES